MSSLSKMILEKMKSDGINTKEVLDAHTTVG